MLEAAALSPIDALSGAALELVAPAFASRTRPRRRWPAPLRNRPRRPEIARRSGMWGRTPKFSTCLNSYSLSGSMEQGKYDIRQWGRGKGEMTCCAHSIAPKPLVRQSAQAQRRMAQAVQTRQELATETAKEIDCSFRCAKAELPPT